MVSRSFVAGALLHVLLQQSSCVALHQAAITAIGVERPPKTNKKKKSSHQHQVDPEAFVERVAQPTGRPEKNETAAEATGVAENAAGDLDAFIAALITNVIIIVIYFLLAGFLIGRYPLVYAKNKFTLYDEVPEDERDDKDLDPAVKEVLVEKWEDKIGPNNMPRDSYFGWWSASYNIGIDDIVEYRGLDTAMLIEFTHVAMKILLIIGLPLCLIIGPCHCFLGGYRAGRPGTPDADYLSYWGMANVVDGHPWLYWAHAIFMWLVIIVVQRVLYNAMRAFLKKRTKWLQKLPTPRATTVLVEGITEDYQSDAELKNFFNNIFASPVPVVDTVFVIKETSSLLAAIKARDHKKTEIAKEVIKLNSTEDGDAKAQLEQSIAEKREELTPLETAVTTARDEVETQAKETGGVNLTKGFVTFKTRRDAEMAKMMNYTTEADEFVCSIPPDPTDVIWHDLQVGPLHEKIWTVIGYALLAGVYWAYLPTVVSIAYFTSIETLAAYSPMFKSMSEDPSFAALWDGLVNALALQLFIAFVPTFFMLIFSNFFVLRSGNSLQHKIQDWYYFFQVIFVLLVTAVGSSLLDTLDELAENPLSVFSLLASTLPLATHFYLNYLPIQWVSHAQNLLRFANLFKFKANSMIFGTAVAVKKCEPEDQDYYGLGSRSARFTFMLTLSLAFSTLSPLITILGFVNFWMCRKVYGYLCVFCETRKPDLGGNFYVSQLTHASWGLFIYIILMTGVLLERDSTSYPGLIAGSGLIFQYISYTRFTTTFRWESLSFIDLTKADDPSSGSAPRLAKLACGASTPKAKKTIGVSVNYEQPEMKK